MNYRKDTEPISFFYLLTSFRYLSITCNTFIACYIISVINYLPGCTYQLLYN